jgi:hypothetical protein
MLVRWTDKITAVRICTKKILKLYRNFHDAEEARVQRHRICKCRAVADHFTFRYSMPNRNNACLIEQLSRWKVSVANEGRLAWARCPHWPCRDCVNPK